MTRAHAGRNYTIDVVRGVAVLGILLMNISEFALTHNATVIPQAGGGMDPVNLTIWSTNFLFVQSKMRGLFSLLFGVSMLLFIDRAEAGGRDGIALHLRRMFWLLVFGLMHYFLLWNGDILALYALCGTVAVLFVQMAWRRQMALACVCFLLSMTVWANAFQRPMALIQRMAMDDAPAHVLARAELRRKDIASPQSKSAQEARAVMKGTYGDAVIHRITKESDGLYGLVKIVGLETIGLMLAGMGLFRAGFFGATAPVPALRRIARVGLIFGLTGSAAILLWCFSRGLDPVMLSAAMLFLNIPFQLALTFAYAALLVLWCRAPGGGLIKARLAAVGSMAFTNYIAMTLIMTTVFQGYGFGLYEMLNRWQLIVLVVATWAAMLVWSPWWLARFAHGPLEWLWRSLTRGEWVAMQLPVRRNGAELG